jgi:Anti-sigma-K factor rskA/Putative zinc-finger
MPDELAEHVDVAGYVLGALEPADQEAFEQHLRACGRCRAEAEELGAIPGLLRQAAPPVDPPLPADLKERTVAAVDRAATQGRRRQWLRLAAVAAAAAVVLFFAGFTLSQVGPLADRDRVIQFSLAAPDGGPARGTAEVRQVGDGLAITMEVSGLAPNPPGSVYECWYVGPGDTLQRPNRVSAGTFTVGADGRASLRMHSAADLQRYPAMGVTLERDRGNPARTGDKVLVSS